MGVCTKINLKSRIEPEIILKYIQDNFDKNATMDIRKYQSAKEDYDITKYYDDSRTLDTYMGFINFTYQQEKRSLFYYYVNYNSYENLKYYKSLGLKDMVDFENTNLSLSFTGGAKEIMLSIVGAFGGWYDENDCDDIPYVWIDKNGEYKYKPIRHITMQDVYDKFGEIVIID